MGAGGKFVLNCIGLSDWAVLQSSELAQKQLDHKLTSQDKLDLLLSRLANQTAKWTDLGLGCRELFGISNSTYDNNLDIDTFKFNPVVSKIINQRLKLGLVAHKQSEVVQYRKVWPNAVVINFTNYLPFLNKYRSDYLHVLPDDYGTISITDAISWDCNNFFAEEQTVREIELIYNALQLPDFDRIKISRYYQAWIQTIINVAIKES